VPLGKQGRCSSEPEQCFRQRRQTKRLPPLRISRSRRLRTIESSGTASSSACRSFRALRRRPRSTMQRGSASVVKVFPAAQVGGPGFHKAVGATYPDMGFIPTGGITAENLSDYLAVLRSVRGWRRVQRRARAEAVLRDEVGARHVPRRQSHRPSDRRLDLSRRCRPSAPSPGALRRCRAFRAERSELHRTGLRRPRRSWLFRPREYGCRSDVGRRGRLGSDLRHRRSPGLEILDRVGGGDSFASGFFYGLMNEYSVDEALAYGVAHGALAMTTPGDTSMATLEEVERLRRGASPRVQRCGATVGRVAVSRAARTARVRSRKN
jgi:hypothetical protein